MGARATWAPAEDRLGLRLRLDVAGQDHRHGRLRPGEGAGAGKQALAVAAVGAAGEQDDVGFLGQEPPRGGGVVEAAAEDAEDAGAGAERGLAGGLGGEVLDQADDAHPQAAAGARAGDHLVEAEPVALPGELRERRLEAAHDVVLDGGAVLGGGEESAAAVHRPHLGEGAAEVDQGGDAHRSGTSA